jgi:hypothetical protein
MLLFLGTLLFTFFVAFIPMDEKVGRRSGQRHRR